MRSTQAKKHTPISCIRGVKGEEAGLIAIREICVWASRHDDKLPSQIAKDRFTRYLGCKLHNLKQSLRGSGKVHVYPSYLREAKKHGYPNLFAV